MTQIITLTCFKYIMLVALCAASISYTITFAGIFKKLVDWIGSKNEWIDELVHCPYCFGHYVILVIMLTTPSISLFLAPITPWVLYNFLFTWFAIVCLMSLFHLGMLNAYGKVAELESFRKFKKNRKETDNNSQILMVKANHRVQTKFLQNEKVSFSFLAHQPHLICICCRYFNGFYNEICFLGMFISHDSNVVHSHKRNVSV